MDYRLLVPAVAVWSVTAFGLVMPPGYTLGLAICSGAVASVVSRPATSQCIARAATA